MPLQGIEKFPKSARLRKRPEFLKLSRAGRAHQSANFVVISKLNDRTGSRLGITVSRKVGNSVVRNRIKRLVREFFRRRRSTLAPACDFLIIARTSAAEMPGKSVGAELERALIQQRHQRQA
ncbi:MAG TPA: ribonuclease P protein component [Candidatus Limnocylindria bacterium]|nr:ribonuclease P protein component [Candidatus Limnocylindria bacterium]